MPQAMKSEAQHITYFEELEQGTEAWFAARCGILTASEMKNVINASLEPVKPTKKEIERGKDISHIYELLAQRINSYVEPSYVGDDMLRGHEDEIYAKIEYEKHYAPITKCGFITNNKWGFKIGFSPDGLVGDDGILESKSRRQKFQMETILDSAMPADYMIQVQTGLLVSERKWCDFISYPARGGMPMFTLRIEADQNIQAAIIAAASDFERRLQEKMDQYNAIVAAGNVRLVPTQRRIEQEITL